MYLSALEVHKLIQVLRCLLNDKEIHKFAQICELIVKEFHLFFQGCKKEEEWSHTTHDNKSTQESRGRRTRNNTCFGQIKFLFPLYSFILDDKDLFISD